MAQMKKPSKPYTIKKDGSSYVRFNGGPCDGWWWRNYPPMQEEVSAFGANYVLTPNTVIDPAFPEDRQIGFMFVGYEKGMGDAQEDV